MSQSTPDPLTLPPDFWRSLEERAQAPGFTESVANEFPNSATLWPAQLDRRDFLRLMGASFAMAGLGGCERDSATRIVPYVSAPETGVPGVAQHYATAFSWEGFARGIVVEAHEGRPTKIEGNPLHPESLGASDAPTQAAVLSLYDPDRSAHPWRAGAPATWEAFDAEWAARSADLLARHGRGLAILLEPTTSPTARRTLARLQAALPQARWYQHTPLASPALDGLQPEYDLAAADVLFSIGSDVLFRHPAAVRHSRAFASRRRAGAAINRFFAIEATPTVTGAQADYRLPASPARLKILLPRLAQLLAPATAAATAVSPEEETFLQTLAADLRRAGARSLCLVGDEQDEEIRRWARQCNVSLGAVGTTVSYRPAVRSDGHAQARGDLVTLSAEAAAGQIDTLFILGTNPVYSCPGTIDFAATLARIRWSAQVGTHRDETGQACTWHLPEAHFLEAWGDLRSYGGVATIQQPLVKPLYPSRSVGELLAQIADGRATPSYELVRATWTESHGAAGFETAWAGWLTSGLVDEPAAAAFANPALASGLPALEEGAAAGLTLLLYPDPTIADGRWANHAWLQELPKPLTHLVWDNAILLAPALAKERGIANGDVIAVAAEGRRIEGAAWVMPGQDPGTLAVSLGYGRRAGGSLAAGRGTDAYPMRSPQQPWTIPGITLTRTGRTYPLVATQHHFTMAGRDLVRVASPDSARVAAPEPTPSLYPEWPRGQYAWGMAIDLSACTGCNACVVACQAENNIPVVGKDQVARGREMHWIRIDQYFEGTGERPKFVQQPVPCMHCENAPCELVCPVGATVHSSEGLNEMVYNRCVGTRYCSNNCPYKVRRFNFLDYRPSPKALTNLQSNPDVSVRERGVMEKCSYCVQRINAGRIAAEKENRPIADGEIRTACEQACPAQAIVFGNVADPHSRVARRKREATSYSLLETLNTRPRTTYLAKLRHGEGGPAA